MALFVVPFGGKGKELLEVFVFLFDKRSMESSSRARRP
jgi:hypothetical protein